MENNILDVLEQEVESEASAFQEELKDTLKKVNEYKLACEANIVAILWKKPELYNIHSYINVTDFTNEFWSVYWQIGFDIVLIEHKQSLDEITVNLYLEKQNELKKVYDEYHGFDTILKAQAYVKTENLEGYIDELFKWNAVIELGQQGFPIANNLSRYSKLSLEKIYQENEFNLNDIFSGIEAKVKSYDISDGIHELIDNLDEGFAEGLEYYNLPLLSNETDGMLQGKITFIGGLYNIDKSAFVRNAIIPSILKQNDKVVIFINKEKKKNWQIGFLLWFANNAHKKDISKQCILDGKYTPELKGLLYKCADDIERLKSKNAITLIPIANINLATKIIKKFASMGVKYFVLDTFITGIGMQYEDIWKGIQNDLLGLYDIIKTESYNVHLTCTFDLPYLSAKQRYYTFDDCGLPKSYIGISNTTFMIRNVMDDEKEGCKNELTVYSKNDTNGETDKLQKLDAKKHYQIIFIVMNNECTSNNQIVIEHDLDRNMIKEIGICKVPQDF